MARTRKGSLPAEVSSFVGRRREISEIKRLLSVTRLLTLTGTGGVGKTRLALRVAEQTQRAFADGAWLVEVASLRDSALLERTVADALGICDQSTRPPLTALVDNLKDKQLLLVLDNCEYIVDACAAMTAELLAAAPGLRILVTSTRALHIAGEQLFPVPPLSLPDLENPRLASGWTQEEAILLFEERARAVAPELEADTDRSTIARICQQLDGLPLAIEMAAARLRVLAPEQILQRLDDRFRLLVGGSRCAPARHRTLRAVVDWSHALCSPDERTLWARASVFADGFDLEAAQAICGGGGIEREHVIDLVSGLVDKSILVRESNGARTRFRMLGILSQYGRQKLRDLGEEPALCRRHRDYYVTLAEREEKEWFGPTQRAIFVRTRAEHDNLRAALEFSLGSPMDVRVGQHLAGTLWFYWVGCGVLGEGRYWLDRALTADQRPSRERSKALWVNGYVTTLQGDVTSAVAMLEECRTYARQVGDEVALAYATHRLGCNALVSDDLEYAQALFEEAQARYHRLGEMSSNVLMAWNELAVTAVFQEDLERAAALCAEARAISEQHGEQWARAYTIYAQAVIAMGHGDHTKATACAQDCLRAFRSFNDLLGMAMAIEVLAWTATMQGMPDRAGILLGAAGTLWRSVGFPLFGSKQFGASHQQCETAVRHAVGDHKFKAIFHRGTAYSTDQAVAYALGEHVRSAASPPAVGRASPLTPREQQVAELIAEGLSNKQIACRLFIAQRTAEGHVERILAKLGFGKRVQLAAWIVEQRGTVHPSRGDPPE